MAPVTYAAFSRHEREEDLVKIGYTESPRTRFGRRRDFVIFMTRPDERDPSEAEITAGILEQNILRFCDTIGVRVVDNDHLHMAEKTRSDAGYEATPSRSIELIRFDEKARSSISKHLPSAEPAVREFLSHLLEHALTRRPSKLGVYLGTSPAPRARQHPARWRAQVPRSGTAADGTDLHGAALRIGPSHGALRFDEPEVEPSW